MAAEPVQLPTSGSLAGILDVLETDEDFRALISDEIEVPESDIRPQHHRLAFPKDCVRRSLPGQREHDRLCLWWLSGARGPRETG